ERASRFFFIFFFSCFVIARPSFHSFVRAALLRHEYSVQIVQHAGRNTDDGGDDDEVDDGGENPLGRGHHRHPTLRGQLGEEGAEVALGWHLATGDVIVRLGEIRGRVLPPDAVVSHSRGRGAHPPQVFTQKQVRLSSFSPLFCFVSFSFCLLASVCLPAREGRRWKRGGRGSAGGFFADKISQALRCLPDNEQNEKEGACGGFPHVAHARLKALMPAASGELKANTHEPQLPKSTDGAERLDNGRV
ncbi:uncharacterized protein Tco025E_07799, partial [Trypanosoma conorhini]